MSPFYRIKNRSIKFVSHHRANRIQTVYYTACIVYAASLTSACVNIFA